jgi:hypothetical protein
MGREAKCLCRWAGGEAQVKALLEGRELILRGGARRTFAIADMTDVRAHGDDLRFAVTGQDYALELGAGQARGWATKILTPSPSLAKKLGVGPASKVRLIGPLDDSALQAALAGSIAQDDEPASQGLAVVADEATLERALAIHAATLPDKPIWVIHGKGPGATYGESAVRRHMRAAGYMDSKVSAVSDALSATRYSPR